MRQRYVIFTFIVGAFLVGWVAQAATASSLAQLEVPDHRIMGVLARSTAVGVLVGVVSLIGGLRYHPAVRFVDEVIAEMVRVTWPSREETIQATSTVIFTTLFVAALLSVYDLVWSRLTALILFN